MCSLISRQACTLRLISLDWVHRLDKALFALLASLQSLFFLMVLLLHILLAHRVTMRAYEITLPCVETRYSIIRQYGSNLITKWCYCGGPSPVHQKMSFLYPQNAGPAWVGWFSHGNYRKSAKAKSVCLKGKHQNWLERVPNAKKPRTKNKL